MLDDPHKTRDLIAAMKSAVPFEVELPPSLLARLRSEAALGEIVARGIVRDISYAGDEGGVVLHVAPEHAEARIVVSLTQVLLGRRLPFAAAALAYQKHRIKKLKKQSRV